MRMIIRARDLGSADRKRYTELADKRVDADLQRELEYEALVFNSAFVRQTWRKQKQSGAGRGQKSKGL